MAVIITAHINYHLIYIGCPVDRRLIYDTWNNGIVDVRPVNNARIRYVLDYINKDPIFADSKYELYGDFEAPFYHFSKGLGFEEIYRLYDSGQFDSLGRIEFGRNHTYTLPPYLKEKLGLVFNYKIYPDSVIKWAEEKHFTDLEAAQINRNQVVECSNTRAAVARGKPFINYQKLEDQESIDRKNRSNGFTDYDFIDSQIGFVV